MKLAKLLPRFRNMQRVLHGYEARECWSRGEVADYQLTCINKLWTTASQTVPYYKELVENNKLPLRFKSLSEYSQLVPVLSKETVRDAPKRFLSTNPLPGSWHRTGGSTGTPMSVYWEHAAHREMLRGKYRCEQSHGIEVFDRKVFLWGHSGSFAPGVKGQLQRLKRPFADSLRGRLRVSAYDLSHNTLQSQLEKIKAFRPRSVYGYSSAVLLLAEAAEEAGMSIPSLRLAILTAEPADTRMLERVSKCLDCKAVTEYGSVECGLIAYLMSDGTLRTRDDLVFVETIANSASTAEQSAYGEYSIVVSVLNNGSFPLLRYSIGDLTSGEILRPESGFGVLTDVQGRRNDVLISKRGRPFHSMAVKHVLEHWPEIRRFTAVQDCEGRLNVKLESPSGLPVSLVRELQSRLVELLEGYNVELQIVDHIPGNLAGKHRWIMSELSGNQRA